MEINYNKNCINNWLDYKWFSRMSHLKTTVTHTDKITQSVWKIKYVCVGREWCWHAGVHVRTCVIKINLSTEFIITVQNAQQPVLKLQDCVKACNRYVS